MLNHAQQQAVEHTDGPLLILAGAGAGKTRVITHRIGNLIQKGVEPSHILAVTFTNKAAREMRERVMALLGKAAAPRARGTAWRDDIPFVATFHSLGVHILRAHASAVHLTRSFTILDRADSLRLLKEAMKSVDINPKEFEPGKILSSISRAKGDALPLADYENGASDFYPRLVARVWRAYEKRVRDEKALDFDDLLLSTLTLLRTHDDIREQYQNTWSHIHIDEYQDTNRVQYELVHILAKPQNNVCVVGDIDQNVYSWRGADIENILSFEKRYPDAHTILLEQNYRSTKTIIDASNTIIQKNKRRKEKRLFTNNAGGEAISLAATYDEADEARFVAETAARLMREGVPASEIAVLYRANFQSRALEEAFLMHSIPYQVLGTRFFERKEVKDILSFVRAALDQTRLGDLKRIINVPPRGIGKLTFLKIASGKEDQLTGKMRQNVAAFRELLERIRVRILSKKPSETIAFILRASGLEAALKKGDADDVERFENLRELAALATRYDALEPEDGMQKLLEDAALATDQDEMDRSQQKEAVKLMTVHASKGLEFDTVFITGLEEGLFPHEALSEGRDDEEEERRLFYVALTRAKRKVYLTYTSVRTIFGSREVNILSSFITDIDNEHLRLEESGEPREGNMTIYLD